jgi:hypothetical protein
MASYAADNVRYLLPLAQRLLSAQAPALGALSTLTAQLAVRQQRQQLLALRPELAERYAPLLAAAEQGGSGDALLQFELRLGEGFAPSYRMYVPEQGAGSGGEDGSSTGQQGREAAAQASPPPQAASPRPPAAQQEQPFASIWRGGGGNASSGVFTFGASGAEQGSDAGTARGTEQLHGSYSEAAEELDQDVCSMLEVLPGRWAAVHLHACKRAAMFVWCATSAAPSPVKRPVNRLLPPAASCQPCRLAALLAPYRSAAHAPALLEIQLDAGSQARAVVSDESTPVPLGLEIPLPEALAALAAAHARAAELQRERSAVRLDQAADGAGGESEGAGEPGWCVLGSAVATVMTRAACSGFGVLMGGE